MTRMDELTQTQIILLTLLVSFITSIATGIITTALLAEAPIGVTQTINRVVERTVEKVVPEITLPNTNSSNEGTIVKEVTIVKEEDAVISAIEKSSRSVVRIYQPTTSKERRGEFYALGIITSQEGLVVSDLRNADPKELFTIQLSDGTLLDARAIDVGTAENIGVFKITPTETHKIFPVIPISRNEAKLGQSVIAIQGRDKNNVALGRVLSLITRSEKNSANENIEVVMSVNTDINAVGETAGGPLLNLSGELIGIKTSIADLSLLKGVYTTVIAINRASEKVQ